MPVAARAGFRPRPSSERNTSAAVRESGSPDTEARPQPCEQLDQRAAGVPSRGFVIPACAPDACDQVFDEVVEAAIVQAR